MSYYHTRSRLVVVPSALPPLLEAISRADYASAFLLLSDVHNVGAYVSERDDAGFTPLHRAASAGHASLVRRLLDCGAAVSAVNVAKMSAVTCAAYCGHLNVVETLLNANNVDRSTDIDLPAALVCACNGCALDGRGGSDFVDRTNQKRIRRRIAIEWRRRIAAAVANAITVMPTDIAQVVAMFDVDYDDDEVAEAAEERTRARFLSRSDGGYVRADERSDTDNVAQSVIYALPSPYDTV